MSKYVFTLFTTITSEIEIDADDYKAAFIEFENRFHDDKIFGSRESVIREYILLDDCQEDFEKMIAGCPEDSLDGFKDRYATTTTESRKVAKLAKYRSGFLTSLQIAGEQVKCSAAERDAGREESARAIWAFGNHLNELA